MSAMKAATILIVLLLLIVGAIALLGERPMTMSRRDVRFSIPGLTKSMPRAAKKTVILYFFARDQKTLQEETREILGGTTTTEDAKRALAELVKGPESDLMPTVPSAAQVRNLFIDSSGIAYVDFDRELREGHRGGTQAELSTVFSIVNTVALNNPQIKRVQILVEGAGIPTLKGNVDTSIPLAPQQTF